jgi:uncharacterized membrane protein YgaE (UPF0421/DUF939 family)
MTNKQSDFLRYIVKCLIGVVIGFYLYNKYPEIGAWCLISIVLVLSPDRKDAIKLALTRIKANLIGAAIGLSLFFIHPMDLLIICIGVVLAVTICQLLNLEDTGRSAAVSVIIILIHEKGPSFWNVALERAGGVVGGCVIAMLITYIFHIMLFKFKRRVY